MTPTVEIAGIAAVVIVGLLAMRLAFRLLRLVIGLALLVGLAVLGVYATAHGRMPSIAGLEHRIPTHVHVPGAVTDFAKRELEKVREAAP